MGDSGIYCWLNTANGKRYVGQSVNLKNRTMGHVYDLRAHTHANSHFQHAWDKYGQSAFVLQICEECHVESLDDREKYWIRYYNSMDGRFGYNKDDGGKANHSLCAESRKKISQKLMGHPVSASVIEKTRLAHLGRKQSAESIAKRVAKMTGRKHSPEAIEKMRMSQKGKIVSAETRAKISAAQRGVKRPNSKAAATVSLLWKTINSLPKPIQDAMREQRKRGPQTPEHIAKCAAIRRGKKLNLTPEQRAARSLRSKSFKRGPMSEQEKFKRSLAAREAGCGLWMKGRSYSDEYKQKMRDVMTGRVLTTEWKEKIAASNRRTYALKKQQREAQCLELPLFLIRPKAG